MGLNIGNIATAADIIWPQGANNTPGIGQFVYYAPITDIAELPQTLVTDPLQAGTYEFEDLVTVTADIQMKPGKQFTSLYCTLEEGEIKSALQGLRDGKSFKLTLDVYFPGSEARYHGFRTYIKNSAGIFIVPDMDGKKYIFGSKCYPANLTGGEWGTAKKGDERKGGNLIFDFNSPKSVTLFEGNVLLLDALGSSSGTNQQLVYC